MGDDFKNKIMIFCKTKKGCEYLSQTIYHKYRMSAVAIHGDKS